MKQLKTLFWLIIFGTFAAALCTDCLLHEPSATATATVARPVTADPCAATPENVADRNYIWGVFNQDAAVEPSRQGFKFAVALGALITADKVSRNELSVNFQRYLMKGLTDLPSGSSAELQLAIFGGTHPERLNAFRRLVENEYRQTALAYCIMRDTQRIELFLAHQRIPYETAR